MTTPGPLRVSGLAFLLLFGGGSVLWWPWGDVRAGDDPAVLAQFFTDSQVRIIVGGTLSVVGIAAFVVFAGVIRSMIENAVVGTVAMFGAGVMAVAGFGAETINMAGAIRAMDDPRLAQALYEVAQVLGGHTSAIGVGIFAIAVGVSPLLGRLAAAVIVAVGVVLLTPLAAYVTEVAGGGLMLVVTVILLGIRRE
jgi:hypothetical protein